MRSSRKRTSVLGAATAGLLFCLDSSLSAGTGTITLTEEGVGAGVISLSLSGSLDWADAAYSTVGGKWINPTWGNMGLAESNSAAWGWWSSAGFSAGVFEFVSSTSTRNYTSVWGTYGTTGDWYGVTYSGDTFLMWSDGIAVNQNLASGQAMSGSGTIYGDFASRGLTAGTVVTTTFKLGSAGTLNTVVIQPLGANAGPGVGGLAALACGAAGMPRRRRRVS